MNDAVKIQILSAHKFSKCRSSAIEDKPGKNLGCSQRHLIYTPEAPVNLGLSERLPQILSSLRDASYSLLRTIRFPGFTSQ